MIKQMKFKPNQYIVILIFLLACDQQLQLEDRGPAGEFSLYNTDSVLYQLTDYRGKIVMIHFWADWCPKCRDEFPRIQKAYQQLQGKNFEILAINSGQSAAHVRDIKTTYQLTYPLLIDRKSETAETYGVPGLPSTYFVNPRGNIVKVFVGWLETEVIFRTVDLIKKQQSGDPQTG